MPRLTQPRVDEPIRIITTKSGEPRYEAYPTTSAPGAKRAQARRRFASLKDARAFVEKTRTDVRSGTFQQRNGMTMRELADLWLASKARPRESTIATYKADLARALLGHEDVPVQSLSTSKMQQWVNGWPTSGGIRGRGVSPTTVRVDLMRLRQLCAHAVKLGVLRSNPAVDLEAPAPTLSDETATTERRTDANVWSFAQLRRFVQEADQEPLPLAIAARFSTAGLRKSESRGMDWGSVDLDAGLIHVVAAKARDEVNRIKAPLSRRTIEIEQMVPGTVKLLRELWLQRGRPQTNTVVFDRDGRPFAGKPSGLIVLDSAGRPINKDDYSRAFWRIAEQAGLPRIRVHAIRHTIATELHDRGIAAATGAYILGHSTEIHLSTYVRSTGDHQRAAAAAFAAAWTEAG